MRSIKKEMLPASAGLFPNKEYVMRLVDIVLREAVVQNRPELVGRHLIGKEYNELSKEQREEIDGLPDIQDDYGNIKPKYQDVIVFIFEEPFTGYRTGNFDVAFPMYNNIISRKCKEFVEQLIGPVDDDIIDFSKIPSNLQIRVSTISVNNYVRLDLSTVQRISEPKEIIRNFIRWNAKTLRYKTYEDVVQRLIEASEAGEIPLSVEETQRTIESLKHALTNLNGEIAI